MYEMTAGAEEERVPQSRFTLSSVLLVAAALAFVTALIVLSGEPSPAWFLYLLPIVIGALAYDIGGGVIVTALSAAAVFLASPSTALSDGWPEFLAGFAVFLMCGIVIGWQARHQRTHRVALERASALDALTGVLKAEYFVSELGGEIRRGDRYGHSVGLVLVHVEDFDEFARLFGHYKSESMLRHLSDIVRLTVRATDTIGRLEPTVFAVILPHAGEAQAAEVADRLRGTTRAAEFEGDALEPITACVTTASSASYPADAANETELLVHARSLLDEASAAHREQAQPAEAVATP
jgi:diguanylate cyclase (GGDEF)-like protein